MVTSQIIAQEGNIFPDRATPEPTIPEESPLPIADGPQVLPSRLSPNRPDAQNLQGDSRATLETGTELPVIEPRIREILVRPNETVTLSLEGAQWIYTGSARPELGGLQRESTPQATRFRMIPRVAGIYELDFQKQDLMTGQTQTQQFRMTVAAAPADGAFSQRVNPPNNRNQEGVLQNARVLASRGDFQQALVLLRPHLQTANKETTLFAADLSEKAGYLREALAYWEKILDMNSLPDEKKLAYAEWFRLAVKIQAPEKVSAMYTRMKGEDSDPANPFKLSELLHLETAELVLLSEDTRQSLRMLFDWKILYPENSFGDRALFLQARIREKAGPTLNLREALESYQELINRYPLSPLTEKARIQAAGLRRTYFQIR